VDDKQLRCELADLAERCTDSHANVAAVLYALLGAQIAGGSWLDELTVLAQQHARRFIAAQDADRNTVPS
jgi:hypothetical protein